MPKQKIILAIVGTIASGKGTAAKYLEEKYGAATYRFSTILRDVLNRLSLGQSRHNMSKLSSILRKNFGEDVLAKVMANDVEKNKNKLIVVEGIRRWADIVYLQKLLNFHLIGLDADAKIRYERLKKRAENKNDDKKTFKRFLAEEKMEADAEVPTIIKKAEYHLNNDLNLAILYSQIDNMIKNLK